MNPKYAPFKCACGTVSWNDYSFSIHIEECPDAREFFKQYTKLIKLHKRLVDEELR